jgi:hypothetical protein
MANVIGDSADIAVSGVKGTNTSTTGSGVEGESASGWGIYGHSTTGRGVVAKSDGDYGLRAHSRLSAGLRASSDDGRGLEGWSTRAEGVHGISESGSGVWGFTKTGSGVVGTSDSGNGGWFESAQGEGVRGWSKNPHHGGVVGVNTGGGAAGFFQGNVIVTGDISLANADCAEEFDVADDDLAAPGTLMALDDDGRLRQTRVPYDTRVAGVVSGAGRYQPGLVLDRRPSDRRRQPIALLGKVYCQVDATDVPIAVGDLLTSASTAGHAMKAGDPRKAFGAVIGKALAPLRGGCALIPVLVTLQ